MTAEKLNDELTEIFTDFLNALESACVNAKRQIAELKGVTEGKSLVAVNETTFSILKFEPQKGVKLGDYETADKKGNLPDKFQQAHNVLRNSNATIQARYHGQGYVFSYWLYGSDKIYRQKTKGA